METLVALVAECNTVIRIAAILFIPVVAVQVMHDHSIFMHTADHTLVIVAVHNCFQKSSAFRYLARLLTFFIGDVRVDVYPALDLVRARFGACRIWSYIQPRLSPQQRLPAHAALGFHKTFVLQNGLTLPRTHRVFGAFDECGFTVKLFAANETGTFHRT